jgi:aspartate 1-decarboxylase
MDLTLLKSKLHRATVTGASLHYEGSMTISQDLAELAGILPYERILVGNMGNGERFETYVIYGRGSEPQAAGGRARRKEPRPPTRTRRRSPRSEGGGMRVSKFRRPCY